MSWIDYIYDIKCVGLLLQNRVRIFNHIYTQINENHALKEGNIIKMETVLIAKNNILLWNQMYNIIGDNMYKIVLRSDLKLQKYQNE